MHRHFYIDANGAAYSARLLPNIDAAASLPEAAEAAAFGCLYLPTAVLHARHILNHWMISEFSSIVWDAAACGDAANYIECLRKITDQWTSPVDLEQLFSFWSYANSIGSSEIQPHQVAEMATIHLSYFNPAESLPTFYRELHQCLCEIRITSAGKLTAIVRSVCINWAPIILSYIKKDPSLTDFITSVSIITASESSEYAYTLGADAVLSMEWAEFEAKCNPIDATSFRRFPIIEELSSGTSWSTALSQLDESTRKAESALWSSLMQYTLRTMCIKTVAVPVLSDSVSSTRSKQKISTFKSAVLTAYPEIANLDVRIEPGLNTKGKLVGCIMRVVLKFHDHSRKPTEIKLLYTKSFSSVVVANMIRRFKLEYDKQFNN